MRQIPCTNKQLNLAMFALKPHQKIDLTSFQWSFPAAAYLLLCGSAQTAARRLVTMSVANLPLNWGC